MPTVFQLFSSQISYGALGWPLPAPGILLAFTCCISLCRLLSAYFKAPAPTPAPTHSPAVNTNSFLSHTTAFLFPDAPFTPLSSTGSSPSQSI